MEESAQVFLADLWSRVVNRPQLVTDAFAPYADAVAAYFDDGAHVRLNKKAGFMKSLLRGRPDISQATANHVERANQTVRTQMRRHTKRTHHQAAVALMIAHYNFCRVHETLCVTPAIEFGLTGHVWSTAELVREAEATPPDLEPLPAPPSTLRPGRKPFRLRVIRGGKIRWCPHFKGAVS